MSNTSIKSDLDEIKGICGVIGSIATAALMAQAFKMLAIGLEFLSVKHELERIMGKDWTESCVRDAECYKIIYDIAKTTVELRTKLPESEEKRIKERLRDELINVLKSNGIKIWCDKRDFGELGTFKECYISYKTYDFRVDELENMGV